MACNTLEYEIPAKFNEFDIISGTWDGMGTTTVYLDSQLVQKVNKSLMESRDIDLLQLAHRSSRQLLYSTRLMDDVKHTTRLVIEPGEI